MAELLICESILPERYDFTLYSKLYRRHLLDMHIEDWHPDFLSQFSPETYVDNLKTAQINYAMVYLQSHAGLCYYPTKTGIMHKALENRPDLIRRVVELCHENSIRELLEFNTRMMGALHPSIQTRLLHIFDMYEIM